MFDPKKSFGRIPDGVSPMPRHGVDWRDKNANWWGGATIASPTMEVAGPAKQAVTAVRRFFDDPKQLNAYYQNDLSYSRMLIRQLLSLDTTTPVIFDASGTSAILLASRIFAHVSADSGRFFTVTTDEGGSLVPAALKGRDPNEMEQTMFQPSSMLFYEPTPVLPYPAGIEPIAKLVSIGKYGNAELVDIIKETVRSLSDGGRIPGCLVLPHVTKTGRILPIKAVSQAVAELKEEGIEIYYIVDDIQGIGRMDAESVENPVDFCDGYVFGSSKALGGLLIASTLVLKAEWLEAFLRRAENGFMSDLPGWISHFQFEPQYEDRFPRHLFKRGAISIPEVVAMREAVRHLFIRGDGNTFSERRQHQLAIARKKRSQVVEALATIPGIEVLESTDDRPLVASIVCFKVPEDWSPNAFKQAMQESKPIVTPSACIGRYVRLDIPEYRLMPSIDVLVSTIRSVLASKPQG